MNSTQMPSFLSPRMGLMGGKRSTPQAPQTQPYSTAQPVPASIELFLHLTRAPLSLWLLCQKSKTPESNRPASYANMFKLRGFEYNTDVIPRHQRLMSLGFYPFFCIILYCILLVSWITALPMSYSRNELGPCSEDKWFFVACCSDVKAGTNFIN